jgi:hypothetical protein
MAKYPKYKYEFEIDGQKVFSAIGEKVQVGDVLIKIHKYVKGELMNRLWISFDGGKWFDLEHGKRTEAGQQRIDFRRYYVGYPQAYPDGFKQSEEY